MTRNRIIPVAAGTVLSAVTAFLFCGCTTAPVTVDASEELRMELVDSAIKAYFVGDKGRAVQTCRAVLKPASHGVPDPVTPSRRLAHRFLESLGYMDDDGDIQKQRLAELRKAMTPHEFVKYVKECDCRWWRGEVGPNFADDDHE